MLGVVLPPVGMLSVGAPKLGWFNPLKREYYPSDAEMGLQGITFGKAGAFRPNPQVAAQANKEDIARVTEEEQALNDIESQMDSPAIAEEPVVPAQQVARNIQSRPVKAWPKTSVVVQPKRIEEDKREMGLGLIFFGLGLLLVLFGLYMAIPVWHLTGISLDLMAAFSCGMMALMFILGFEAFMRGVRAAVKAGTLKM